VSTLAATAIAVPLVYALPSLAKELADDPLLAPVDTPVGVATAEVEEVLEAEASRLALASVLAKLKTTEVFFMRKFLLVSEASAKRLKDMARKVITLEVFMVDCCLGSQI
jgi:hypothetical protein